MKKKALLEKEKAQEEAEKKKESKKPDQTGSANKPTSDGGEL